MSEELLDDTMQTVPISIKGYLLSLWLIGTSVWSWQLIREAGYLPYDYNYSNILFAFFIAIFNLTLLLLFFWKKRNLFYQNRIVTLLWILTSSPISFYYVCTHYQQFFGQLLKHSVL
jgi:hypothetical protein